MRETRWPPRSGSETFKQTTCSWSVAVFGSVRFSASCSTSRQYVSALTAFAAPMVTVASMSNLASSVQAVSDPNDEVLKILSRYGQGALGICGAAEQILNRLNASGFMRVMTIHPDQVGIDPCNRAGEGVNAMEVGLLAADIAAFGWCWDETAHAICVEVAPGDSTVESFNMDLVRGAEGLAPVREGTIKFGSLACGHTNYGLRAIGAGAVNDCPLLSRDGVYDVELVSARDPAFGKAVREGLKWKVLGWQVRFMYPRVLDMIQRARNANSNVTRRENEMSGLLQLHQLSVSSSMASSPDASGPSASCSSPVDWNAIKKHVLKTTPPFAPKVDNMVAFVIARSGGQEGLFLKHLPIFFRNFVNPSKQGDIPASVYTALAEFPHHYLA